MNGLKLKRLRETKGISRKELANVLNLATVTVSCYENETREPDNTMLKKIANYFNVTTDYLLDNEDAIDKSDYELREKLNFVNFLIRNKFIKKNDTFNDDDIDNIMEFIKINKKYVYKEKSNKK